MNSRVVMYFLGRITAILSLGVVFYGIAFVIETGRFYLWEDKKTLFLLSSPTLFSLMLFQLGKKTDAKMGDREAILLVVLTWFLMIVFGASPYLVEGLGISDAIFESASGYSTTGSTILFGFEQYTRSLMFYRSFTQWVGGMGIIVFFVAILPALGTSGRMLFKQEAPGPLKESLTPQIKHTTRFLWLIYLLLTLFLVIIFLAFGMSSYDSFVHAFTTISSGGFSPYENSVGVFSNGIQWVIVLFMLLSGVNFSIFVNIIFNRKWAVLKDTEFTWYILFLIFLGGFAGIYWGSVTEEVFADGFRQGFFTVVSLVTSTGYSIVDYELFPIPLQTLLLLCFFTGASASSTSGGIKFFRLVLFFKAISTNIKSSFFPELVTSVRINHYIIPSSMLEKAMIFVSIYFTSVGAFCMFFYADGLDFFTAFTAAASFIGNIGPAFSTVGPTENFAHFSSEAKLMGSFAMVLGRLEFFALLTILHPFFWRSR